MSWRIYLADTITGSLGRRIDVTSFPWSDELNGIGGGSFEVKKTALKGLHERQFAPWWSSVVLCHVDAAGEETIWLGGPITNWPVETREALTLSWAGMREMFTRRVVDTDLKFQATTPGQLMWELLRVGMDKPGGGLPIVHGIPQETGETAQEYYSWNLANNSVDALLTKLSDTGDGPDIHFRPRWFDENRSQVVWELVHGTQAQPTLPQVWMPDWDTTAARAEAEVTINGDSTHITDRVYATGAGEGAGTVIGFVEDLAAVQDGRPLLETVLSYPDEKYIDALRQKAKGDLQTNRVATDQVTLKVRADSAKNAIGRWHVGDAAKITLGDEWFQIPEGTHTMRIIKASGDLTEDITLELQEDSW